MKFSSDSVKLRATAMRSADRLSRLVLPAHSQAWQPISAKRRERYLFEMDALKDWPEIDCDLLLLGPDGKVEVIPDDGSAPAIWPINTAVAIGYEGQLSVIMVRTAALKETRPHGRVLSPFIVKGQSIDIDQHDRVENYGVGFSARINKKWVDVCGTQLSVGNVASGSLKEGKGNETFTMSLAVNRALRRRYEWSAIFNFPNGLALRFSCAAKGALELFRDREKGDDEERRRALLHWVRKHWRKPSTAAEISEVRRHLRGVTTLSWRGMEVQIVPSDYELEQAA